MLIIANMIPEFIFIAAGSIVLICALIILRQKRAAFAADLATRITTLETHLQQRNQLLIDVGSQEQRRAFLQQSCDQLSQRESQLKEDIVGLEPRANLIREQVTTLTQEKAVLQATLQDLEQEKRKWEQRIQELDRLDTVIGETTNKLASIETEIAEANSKLESKKDELQQLELLKQQLTVLKQELQDTESRKQAALQELAEAQKQNSEIQQSKEQLLKEIKEAQEELQRVENRRKDVESLTASIEASLGVSGASKSLTQESFAALFKPVFDQPKNQRLANEAPKSRLPMFKKELRQIGFSFPDRLIDAFHTSLMVQDISCLTVMAGISGTGKSILPRLYADYMGIHFLMMPVEPRWDSPQDLFGFLNYMENRYEATPLGRALVQFNVRDESAQSPMQQQMLMVLLDEMNLARIEYYFSEFLSRLESRRDLDWRKSAEAYRKVSLEIFAGKDAATDSERIAPIRLFAGPNVLFVGTMNEDESTQSLSDKVIDRSNSLHFGRPQELVARNQMQAVTANAHKLALNAWEESKRPLDGAASQAAQTFLNELNASFADLGRPFGHRSFAATCAYLANHPNGSQDTLSGWVALSDQIAMRFLPKLRGLDIKDHKQSLDQLRQQISKLEDRALMNAYGQAIDEKAGFFNWTGFDWGS
jgi:predicted  nucleic acid-binding Zn-ribbon protein